MGRKIKEILNNWMFSVSTKTVKKKSNDSNRRILWGRWKKGGKQIDDVEEEDSILSPRFYLEKIKKHETPTSIFFLIP